MKVKVSFEVEIPKVNEEICKDDVDEWINYELGALGGISGGNPLNIVEISGAENIIVDEV